MSSYSSDEERFDNISEWAITILKQHKITNACLEGYSMGSRGRVFAIAENIGLLKHKLWKMGVKFITPAPTSVKKTFTGKGNAKKSDMYAAMKEMNVDFDLETVLECSPDSSPVADIVDSYAMVHHFLNNIDSKV
jgi:Holliday junction resolvasome RuvABC endonuclease subunit